MKRNDHPLPLEIERKYLIAMPDIPVLLSLPGVYSDMIEQVYLTATPGTSRRIRRRVHPNGEVSFTETVKERVSDLTCVEHEREITSEDYSMLLSERDATRNVIQKQRLVIPFSHHIIEVDVYPFWQKIAVAEVELSREDESVSLPTCIHVLLDVSTDPCLKNRSLARYIPDEAELLTKIKK